MNKCCDDPNNPSKYVISFDCGTKLSKWLVCQKHYDEDPLFKKHVDEIKEVDHK